ncbi:MAG: 2-oxoglutarate and iron-dependent oxygenase domain-containing protein, partial [Acidimicrobiales bacterium]
MPMTSRVPLVDLTAADEPVGRSEVVGTIGRACEDSGFLVVTGHGVDRACIEGIDGAARAFFALPLEDKMRYARTDGIYRGYTPAEGSALAASR